MERAAVLLVGRASFVKMGNALRTGTDLSASARALVMEPTLSLATLSMASVFVSLDGGVRFARGPVRSTRGVRTAQTSATAVMEHFVTLSTASASVHQAIQVFSVRRAVSLGNMASGVSTAASVSMQRSATKRMGNASVSRVGRGSTATKSVLQAIGVRTATPSVTARILASVTSVLGSACVFQASMERNASKLVRPWSSEWDARTTAHVCVRIP